jgi:hypothetical protein
MRSMNPLFALRYVAFLALALFTLQACTPTGERFVPQNTQETIAYASISIKAFSKSVKAAYAGKLITLKAAQQARDSLQTAQDALVLANNATTPGEQETALANAQKALLIVAQILEAMQEPQP